MEQTTGTMNSTMAGDIWSKIEFDLSELRDLFHMRLETKEEAIGERTSPSNPKTGKKAKWRDTAPRWEDPEAGERLLDSIERRIAARELTPDLLHEWGLLDRWAGALESVYHAKPNIGRLREGAFNLDGHRRWFADYFLRAYRRGQMEETRDLMERFINSIFQDLPAGEERDWFGRFLGDKPSESFGNGYRRLTGAFREDLSVARMQDLVKQPPGDIPSLDLDFPHPRGGLAPRTEFGDTGVSRWPSTWFLFQMENVEMTKRISQSGNCAGNQSISGAEPILTIIDAAEALGVHVWALRRAVKAGTIPAYAHFNGRKLVRLSEVVEAINASRIGGAE